MTRTQHRDWTTKELAGAAGVTQVYIRLLLKDGTLQGYKRGRDWFIEYEAGERWLEARRKKKNPPPK
jgi:excisionase family DNA binding protein